MNSNIKTWLEFALQQMAAESYLNEINLQNGPDVVTRLRLGNNHFDFPIDSDKPGNTRFTETQATQFFDDYEIIDHLPNVESGFSATLMRERGTDNYTLSFRSTEYKNQAQGGDFERDGIAFLGLDGGADGEIFNRGFAFAQLVDMEDYYASLKATGKLPGNATLNVTGYSLGAHLATVFTELHTEEVNHTYTFNAAGRGNFNEAVGSLADMLDYYRTVLVDPEFGFIPPVGDENRDEWEAALAVKGNPLPFGNESIYDDPRQTWAIIETQRQFETRGRNDALFFDDLAEDVSAKITQLFGHATQDDQEVVANSLVHAPATSVFIEDQPNIDGFGGIFGSSGDFGTTHSITLIVDSLTLMDLFQSIDATLDQSAIESIFAATSNKRATGVDGIAEGDSLELALDALRKVFAGAEIVSTDFDETTGGFGDMGFRNIFHNNIDALRLAAQSFPNINITSIATKTASEIVTQAEAGNLAYRYALVELNPFIVEGHPELYAPFNNTGQLDDLSSEYINDRAEFIALYLNENTDTVNFDSSAITFKYFEDAESGRIIPREDVLNSNQIRFGGDGGDSINGSDKKDRLYGGGGNDFIDGKSADDYLEGNQGQDQLVGGFGEDTLLGGKDNDVLWGGNINGSDDNAKDTLKGGKDFDTYLAGYGDEIEDSDGFGQILFRGSILREGYREASDPTGEYTSVDGEFNYVLNGTTLTVSFVGDNDNSHSLTVNNFSAGQLGINLSEQTAPEFARIHWYRQQ